MLAAVDHKKQVLINLTDNNF